MTDTFAHSGKPAETSTLPAEPRSASDTVTHPSLLRYIRPLASLRLTVVLLAMSVFLIFAGTLALVDRGIWQVMEDYFRTKTGIAWIELPVFFPRAWDVPNIVFPYPGGWLLGGVLLINLLAAHAVRFKVKATGSRMFLGWCITLFGVLWTGALVAELHFQIPSLHDFYIELLLITIVTVILGVGCWMLFDRRCGIVMLHAALIFLLASEGVTGWLAVESQMWIPVGASSNFTRDVRTVELAIVDAHGADDPNLERVTVIPQRFLEGEGTIENELMPFDVEVRNWLVNSTLREAASLPPGHDRPEPFVDFISLGRNAMTPHIVIEHREASGARGEENWPAVDVALTDRQTGQILFEGRISTWHTARRELVQLPPQLQQVKVGDRTYEVALRFQRTYKPYTITLNRFVHDVYPGTDTPKDFSSYVHFVDPTQNEDREVRIWMNHPLRYEGETFYQTSVMPGDMGTILQVVKNPGRVIPYLSCLMVAGGLIVHFMYGLIRFNRKRQAA